MSREAFEVWQKSLGRMAYKDEYGAWAAWQARDAEIAELQTELAIYKGREEAKQLVINQLETERDQLKSCEVVMRVAIEHVLRVFKSMADRGAYPLELLPMDDTGAPSVHFLGKQGWQFLTDALAQSQPQPTVYKFGPSECPHASAMFKCNDCGLDFKHGNVVLSQPLPGVQSPPAITVQTVIDEMGNCADLCKQVCDEKGGHSVSYRAAAIRCRDLIHERMGAVRHSLTQKLGGSDNA